MPVTSVDGASKRRKYAAGLTRFPSLVRWEDPWEGGLDLDKLRGKEAALAVIRTLANDPRHAGEAPHVDRKTISNLVFELRLEPEKATRLIEDAILISEWYLQPVLQRRIRLGHDLMLTDLEEAAKAAEKLHFFLGPVAADAEHLFAAMPTELGVSEDTDLAALSRRAGQFAQDVRRSLAHLVPPGRKRDARRNVAIALTTWAVENATGERVLVSRGRADRSAPHFRNRSGRFVPQFLFELGRWDERVLVSAFEKLRRQPAATKRG